VDESWSPREGLKCQGGTRKAARQLIPACFKKPKVRPKKAIAAQREGVYCMCHREGQALCDDNLENVKCVLNKWSVYEQEAFSFLGRLFSRGAKGRVGDVFSLEHDSATSTNNDTPNWSFRHARMGSWTELEERRAAKGLHTD
jgi:hypothetical protein